MSGGAGKVKTGMNAVGAGGCSRHGLWAIAGTTDRCGYKGGIGRDRVGAGDQCIAGLLVFWLALILM